MVGPLGRIQTVALVSLPVLRMSAGVRATSIHEISRTECPAM